MIAKEMEKFWRLIANMQIESKREHTERRLLYKTPVSGLYLQTKGNHGIHDKEGEVSIHV